MKMKFIAVSLLVIPALALVSGARSATMESAAASGASSFNALGPVRFSLRLAAPKAQEQVSGTPVQGKSQPGAVVLEGFVNLEGRAFAMPGGGSVTVFLSGRASLADASQVYTCGPVEVDSVAHVVLGGGSPYAVAPVEQRVAVYKNGQKVGETEIRGSIFVDGESTMHWVILRGMGSVSASFTPGKS